MELVSPGCVVCGAPVGHAALCPVPSVTADPNRAGVREIAISDLVDRVDWSACQPAQADALREAMTTVLGFALNWGIRQGYAQAAAHVLGAVATGGRLQAQLDDVLRRHVPK